MPLEQVPLSVAVNNKYPELPEYAPLHGAIDPAEFDAFVDSLNLKPEQKASAKVIARWESGSSLTKVTGGTNPYNFQADEGRWGHAVGVIGTMVFVDHMGNNRRFVVFDTWQNCTRSFLNYILSRGMYIGAGPNADFDPGNSVTDAPGLYARYTRAWIYGDEHGKIDENESTSFVQVYDKFAATEA